MPLHPSTAHTRSANRLPAVSISVNPTLSVAYLPVTRTRPVGSTASMVAERLCGSIPMMTLSIPPVLGDLVGVRAGEHR